MLLTDLDRYKRDTSSHVLEGQVEAVLRHWPHLPDLCIEAKNSIAKISLREALVCCDGVHLKVMKKKNTLLVHTFLLNNMNLVLAGASNQPWHSQQAGTVWLQGAVHLSAGKRG